MDYLARALSALALVAASPMATAAYGLQPYQTFPTAAQAEAVAVGDLNGDGRDDIVLATAFAWDAADQHKILVYLQLPDGTLASPQILDYSHSYASRNGIAMADLDGDGRMEAVIGHGFGISIVDWKPFGRGGATVRIRHFDNGHEDFFIAADDVAISDIDRDGAPDIFAQSWSDGATIYFGDGLGGVSRTHDLPTPAGGYNDLESGDLNNDGHDDIVVLSGQGVTNAYVYYNDGTDDLSEPLAVDPNPDSFTSVGALATGDFNNDGRDDLAVMRDDTSLSLFLQDASGGLLPAQTIASDWHPNAMMGSDLDLDGRPDLVVLHGSGALGIYLQDSGGLAAEQLVASPYATWFNTQGIAAGDVNGDACPDIVIANPIGLVIHPGSGCNPVADLATSVGLTPTHVALRIDNSGTNAAAAPESTLSLSLTAGGVLSVGALPAGCLLEEATSRTARITCISSALSAGSSVTTIIPITVAGTSTRSVLGAVAGSATASPELNTSNNIAKRSLRVGSLPAGVTTRAKGKTLKR